MTIASLDDLIGSAFQRISWYKQGVRTTTGLAWFSVIDVAGAWGSAAIAGSNTSAGVVPTDATAGYPPISNFAGGALGYLTRMQVDNTVACRLALYDRLFVAGAYAFNAGTVTLASQPSFTGRIPTGDETNTELWVECVTATTGSLSVAITYTNQAGTTGKTTGTLGLGTLTVGRMIRCLLASGDSGIQKIESVTPSVASAGTFNVCVLRKLGSARVFAANDGLNYDAFACGMPQLYDSSALFVMINPDSTAIGTPTLDIDIRSK